MIPNTSPSKPPATSITRDISPISPHRLDIDESESGIEASLSSMAGSDGDDEDASTLSCKQYSPFRPLQQRGAKRGLAATTEPTEELIMSTSSSSSIGSNSQAQGRNIPTPSSGYEGDTEGTITDAATASRLSSEHPHPHHYHHHHHHHHLQQQQQHSPFSSGAEHD